MKVILLDHDGVICLSGNWGSRFKKQQKAKKKLSQDVMTLPVDARFDNFEFSPSEDFVPLIKDLEI